MPDAKPNVWIPQGTPDKYIALLPSGLDLHVLPVATASSDRLGPGQFVVAGFNRRGLADLLRRLDDVRVVQAMSAGVEDLVGHIPEGAVLCDAAGVHDASVADWVVMAILAMYLQRALMGVAQQLGLVVVHPGAVLVKPARGRIVNTEALMQAIERHRIRAALDVTDPEPLPEGHPLWKMDGVLVTPHMAGSVVGVNDRAWRLIADQLRRYLSGEPLINVVSEGY